MECTKIVTAGNNSKVNGSELPEEVVYNYLACLSTEAFKTRTPVVVYLSLLTILGIGGNLLVMWIYWIDKRHSANRIFILTMALCDLTTGVVGLPLQILTIRWSYNTYSYWFCRGMFAFATLPTQTSSAVLVTVALERFQLIWFPHKKHLTSRQAIVLNAAVTIIVSVIFALFIPLYGIHSLPSPIQGLQVKMCWIDDQFRNTKYLFAYAATLEGFFYGGIIPMTSAYIMIGVKLWRKAASLSKYSKSAENRKSKNVRRFPWKSSKSDRPSATLTLTSSPRELTTSPSLSVTSSKSYVIVDCQTEQSDLDRKIPTGKNLTPCVQQHLGTETLKVKEKEEEVKKKEVNIGSHLEAQPDTTEVISAQSPISKPVRSDFVNDRDCDTKRYTSTSGNADNIVKDAHNTEKCTAISDSAHNNVKNRCDTQTDVPMHSSTDSSVDVKNIRDTNSADSNVDNVRNTERYGFRSGRADHCVSDIRDTERHDSDTFKGQHSSGSLSENILKSTVACYELLTGFNFEKTLSDSSNLNPSSLPCLPSDITTDTEKSAPVPQEQQDQSLARPQDEKEDRQPQSDQNKRVDASTKKTYKKDVSWNVVPGTHERAPQMADRKQLPAEHTENDQINVASINIQPTQNPKPVRVKKISNVSFHVESKPIRVMSQESPREKISPSIMVKPTSSVSSFSKKELSQEQGEADKTRLSVEKSTSNVVSSKRSTFLSSLLRIRDKRKTKSKTMKKKVKHMKSHTTRMMAVLTVIYIVNWMPHLIARKIETAPVNMCPNFTECGYNIYALALRSYYINSAVNAFVYGMCSTVFRNTCSRLIRHKVLRKMVTEASVFYYAQSQTGMD